MMKIGWVPTLLMFGFLAGMSGCAEMGVTSPQGMIGQHGHGGLANYYAQQAGELREKATHWEFMAEYYDKHPEPGTKTDSAQHAAHGRTIAPNYQKAVDEAEALAREHRAMRPHGVTQ